MLPLLALLPLLTLLPLLALLPLLTLLLLLAGLPLRVLLILLSLLTRLAGLRLALLPLFLLTLRLLAVECIARLHRFGQRFRGFARRRISLLLLQTFLERRNVLGELLRALRHALLGLVRRPTTRGGVTTRHVALLLGKLLGFVAQRLHRPLKRGALENLGALLERFAHFFLLLGELLQRHLTLLGGELLRGVVEFLERVEHLRREGVAQHPLGIAQLLRERGVERTGGTQPIFERLGGLLQLLHTFGHLFLVARQRFLLLRFVERHILLTRFARFGAGAARIRRFGGALHQLRLRLGRRGRTRRGRVGGGARRNALLVRRRHAQNQLAAHSFLPPRRLVAGHQLHVHRITSAEHKVLEVDHHRRRKLRTAGAAELFHGRHIRTPVARHAPQLERHRLQGVIIRREQLQFDLVGRRNEGITRWRKNLCHRHGVRHHIHHERRGHIGNRRRESARCPRPTPRGLRHKTPTKPAIRRHEPHALAALRECDARQRLRGVAVNHEFRAFGHAHVGITGERFRWLVQIRGIHGPQRHIAKEGPIDHAHHQRVARGAAVGRDHGQVGVEGPHIGRRHAIGHHHGLFGPRIAGRAPPQHQRRAPGRAHRQPQRRATHRTVRHVGYHHGREQRPAPRGHRMR